MPPAGAGTVITMANSYWLNEEELVGMNRHNAFSEINPPRQTRHLPFHSQEYH